MYPELGRLLIEVAGRVLVADTKEPPRWGRSQNNLHKNE